MKRLDFNELNNLDTMVSKKKQCWQQGKYAQGKSLHLQDKCRISNTVKQRWDEGAYNERRNGMLNKNEGITFIQYDPEDIYNPVVWKYNNKIQEV